MSVERHFKNLEPFRQFRKSWLKKWSTCLLIFAKMIRNKTSFGKLIISRLKLVLQKMISSQVNFWNLWDSSQLETKLSWFHSTSIYREQWKTKIKFIISVVRMQIKSWKTLFFKALSKKILKCSFSTRLWMSIFSKNINFTRENNSLILLKEILTYQKMMTSVKDLRH